MENEPESTPYVYGEVKVCRLLKCFSYEMFIELNPEISALNFYTSKKNCPKRPSRTIPVQQIQKLVRLKESPCLSRKSYMKLVLPDDTIALCFYEREVCQRWMNFIKQAIIYAKYIDERSQLVEQQPVLRETLRKTNSSRVELVDSVEPSGRQSAVSDQEVFVNEKKCTLPSRDLRTCVA